MAEQMLQLPADQFRFTRLSNRRVKRWQSLTIPIDTALLRLSPASLVDFYIREDGRISLTLASSAQDLTNAVETAGIFTITVGTNSLDFGILGAASSTPYNWIPTNSVDVIAFYNAIGTSRLAATLILRDGPKITSLRAFINNKRVAGVYINGKKVAGAFINNKKAL